MTVDVTTAPAPSTLVARADHAATRQGTRRHRPRPRQRLRPRPAPHRRHRPRARHRRLRGRRELRLHAERRLLGQTTGSPTRWRTPMPTERSADVEIAVAPSTAGYGVKVGGAPAAAGKAGLVEGQGASWGAAVAPAPAGVTDEALAALPLPAVTAELGGAHALKPSSVRTARGWTAEPVTAGARTLHAKAGSDALLGEVVRRDPAAAAGHRPGHRRRRARADPRRLEGLRVLPPQQPDAGHLRRPGHGQPSAPAIRRRSTRRPTNIPGPAVVVGTRIYVHLSPMQFAAQRTAHGPLLLGRREGPHLRPDRRRPARRASTPTPPRPC